MYDQDLLDEVDVTLKKISKHKKIYKKYVDVRALGCGKLPEDYSTSEEFLQKFINIFDHVVVHSQKEMDINEYKALLIQKITNIYESAILKASNDIVLNNIKEIIKEDIQELKDQKVG